MGKPYTAKHFTVEHHSQEFDCFRCGWPVDVGDRAVEVRCWEREATFVVCSSSCNERDLEEWRQ